jgi:HEAT repeat protein
MNRLVPGLVIVASLVAATFFSGPAVALSAATPAPAAASAAGAHLTAAPTPAALAAAVPDAAARNSVALPAAGPAAPKPPATGPAAPNPVAGAPAADLTALWRDACLWEVGSNKDKVPEARKALIAEGDRTLDYLIPAKLDTKDTLITRALQVVLTGIGKSAVPRLLPCLDSPSASVRRNAADLLGALGAVESAPAIARLLSDPDARLGALAALAALKSPAAVREIADLLRSGAPERVRVTAAATLGAIGGGPAIAALVEQLGSTAAPVRFAAQYALEQLKAVDPLRAKLADAGADPRARLHAIAALGHIADPAARADLRPLLDDPSPVVRGFAIEALGAMADGVDSAEFRRRLPAETDPFVRGKLEEALASRPPQ